MLFVIEKQIYNVVIGGACVHENILISKFKTFQNIQEKQLDSKPINQNE